MPILSDNTQSHVSILKCREAKEGSNNSHWHRRRRSIRSNKDPAQVNVGSPPTRIPQSLSAQHCQQRWFLCGLCLLSDLPRSCGWNIRKRCSQPEYGHDGCIAAALPNHSLALGPDRQKTNVDGWCSPALHWSHPIPPTDS